MSQENVDVMRNGNAAFRNGDWDAIAANLDPDILLRMDARWPEQRIYGRDAAIAFYRGLWESAGPDVRIEATIDLGDRVLVRMRWHMRGLQSGLEGQQPTSLIATFRDGRVILVEFFLEHDHALKAVGLSE
jgi:ketosteroid isomerase-like protein